MDYNIYCDGGCRGNGKVESLGGWGFFCPDKPEIFGFGGKTYTTSQQMELTAFLEALKLYEKYHCLGDKVVVFTDSTYLAHGVNKWSFKWRKKDFDGIKNPNLWRDICELVDKIKPKVIWIKGHSGIEGNEKADKLATLGMDGISRSLEKVPSIVGAL